MRNDIIDRFAEDSPTSVMVRGLMEYVWLFRAFGEAEAIFTEVNRVNQAADADAHTLRLSIDAKATVRNVD